MFQGVFDILLARKIVSTLLFDKCSRFHISHIVYEKFFLAIVSLGLGTSRSFALLVSYFETRDVFLDFCLRISGHCSFRSLWTIIAWSSLINSFTLNAGDGILSLIGADCG